MKQLVLFAILFAGLLMAGVFAASDKNEERQQMREEYREQFRNISDHASVNANYENAKMKWEEKRSEFQSSNGNLSDSAKNASKDYLYNLIDLMVSHILQVQDRIMESTQFSDEDKEDMISSLDDDIATLESLRSDLDSAEDKAAIKAVAADVRDAWKEAKSQMKMQAGYIVASNLEELAGKFEQHMERLKEQAAGIEADGGNVSGMDEAIANAEQNMVQARADIEAAKQVFLSGGDFDEGKQLLSQAREGILGASSQMRNAIREAERVQNRAGEGKADENAPEPETPGEGNEDSQGGNQPDEDEMENNSSGKGGNSSSKGKE